jgi:HK97 family phage prohead protease/HK97 family phage major capsid protein
MLNKKLFIKTQLTKKEVGKDKVKIKGYASTNNTDRAGDVILPEAWSKGIADYQKNPILLFNHNYDKPIGRTTSIEITDKGLEIEGEISRKAADNVADLIEDDVLKAFSVGFMVKDADYDSASDLFVIKEAELYEVSVVSVPCNQDAVFSVSKSFDSSEEYKKFINDIVDTAEQPAEDSVNAQDSAVDSADSDNKSHSKEKNEMDPKELQKLMDDVAAKTASAITEAQSAKAAEDAKAAAEAEKAQKEFDVKVKTSAEKLMEDIEKRFSEKNEALESIVAELQDELSSKSEEITKMRESKRHFADRSEGGDWKKNHEEELTDTFVLGLATGKGWNTKHAKDMVEKVNTMSGVQVSSEDFEQIVSTKIERDIQNELILAPMFRELSMTSATMIMPILPDAGYAEFVSTQTTSATAPTGNLDERSAAYGDNAGITLQERTVSTKKLMSVSYLGNETEEDAILPILPLIRESMIRSHARAIENAILLGNHADGAFGTAGASFDGLVKMATDDLQTIQPAATGFTMDDVVTTADLFNLRKNMGKYGLRPEDVVYIVSQEAYYNLIDDAEFQDANLVGQNMATKLTGRVGSVFGSNVVVCDEFAAKAADKFNAVAVNTRNFVIPRLRGMTVESDYEVSNQRRVLVASQRMGFIDIIDGAAAKYALQYKGVA